MTNYKYLVKNSFGFNVVEVLVVAGVMMLLIIMGGGLAGKFSDRRSIDNIANNVASTLHLIKLQSSKQGVEFQAIINYNTTDNEVTITTQRGDSNRNSVNYETLREHKLKLNNQMEIDPPDVDIVLNFSPNNLLSNLNNTIIVKPTVDSKIKRCGKISVGQFGKIYNIAGNWDSTETDIKLSL